jgi:peptidoglycan/LPS O-acetylase OafA/YrhL
MSQGQSARTEESDAGLLQEEVAATPAPATARETIGSRLDASRGLGEGFDFLRIFLALLVVTWHTPAAANGGTFNFTRFLWIGDYAIVTVFFALSGFLVAASALRLSLANFLINRALRILPALAVEIVLSALILGPLFTKLPLGEYLSSPKTLHYFSNIVGLINYSLPGVFVDHPNDTVNVSLWTVPYEITCYVMAAGLISFALLKRPWAVVALALFILAVGLGLMAVGFSEPPHGHLDALIDHVFYGHGSRLYIAFNAGIAAYLYRYKLPYSPKLFAGCALWCVGVALLGHTQYPFPEIDLLIIAPLTYVTAYLGVSKLPRLPFFHKGDYSYGVYLYGWPVMQAMRGWFPTVGRNPPLLWLISIVPILAIAVFSWHVVEKPVVRLRKKFSFVARQRLAEAPPTPALAGAEYDRPILGAQSQQL